MALSFSAAVTEAKGGWHARAHLPVLALVIVAHAVAFLTYEPGDLVVYVSHWYERVHSLGFSAFSQPFSNYTPPYLYLLWAASLSAGTRPRSSSSNGSQWSGRLADLRLYRLFTSFRSQAPP